MRLYFLFSTTITTTDHCPFPRDTWPLLSATAFHNSHPLTISQFIPPPPPKQQHWSLKYFHFQPHSHSDSPHLKKNEKNRLANSRHIYMYTHVNTQIHPNVQNTINSEPFTETLAFIYLISASCLFPQIREHHKDVIHGALPTSLIINVSLIHIWTLHVPLPNYIEILSPISSFIICRPSHTQTFSSHTIVTLASLL